MKNKIIESLFGFKPFIFDNISLSGTDVNLFSIGISANL